MDAGRAAGALSEPVLALRRHLDPVLEQAGLSWNDSGLDVDEGGRPTTVLYEADAVDFDRRYPEAGLPESYGDQWPAWCIDLWLHLDWEGGRLEFDLEGFEVVEDLQALGHKTLAERVGRLTDDTDADLRAIATALAVVLRVDGPRPTD